MIVERGSLFLSFFCGKKYIGTGESTGSEWRAFLALFISIQYTFLPSSSFAAAAAQGDLSNSAVNNARNNCPIVHSPLLFPSPK